MRPEPARHGLLVLPHFRHKVFRGFRAYADAGERVDGDAADIARGDTCSAGQGCRPFHRQAASHTGGSSDCDGICDLAVLLPERLDDFAEQNGLPGAWLGGAVSICAYTVPEDAF